MARPSTRLSFDRGHLEIDPEEDLGMLAVRNDLKTGPVVTLDFKF